ncbi:unnamed protein product, partial [Thlaspi arvense]
MVHPQSLINHGSMPPLPFLFFILHPLDKNSGFAPGMKHNPRVHLTVIKLLFNQEMESANWEYILDNESLKNFKTTEETNNVDYTERVVTSSIEVASIVRLLAREYHLMVVGRDQGMASQNFSGLTEWVELPELGVIGDLLAAKDLSSNGSVLVLHNNDR